MSLFQVVALAMIQGLTEFLPISSSAHLILPSALLNWPDQGLAFDVAVHFGTLLAVLGYFRQDLWLLSRAWCAHCYRGHKSPDSRMAWFLIVATIPAGLAGLVFGQFIETHLRSVLVIATTTTLFGLLLGYADRQGERKISLNNMSWRQAIYIGISQALALIPGTSRSGITMTVGLLLGFDRVSAAKFSFLLAIPIILLSGIYKATDLLSQSMVPWAEIGLATLVSAVTAYLCIRTFLVWVNRVGMLPFVYYRLFLGATLFLLLLTGQV